MRRASLFLVLFACGGHETPRHATEPVVIPSATASASTVVVEPVPLPASYAVYVAEDWRVAVERLGDDARFVLHNATMDAKPIELAGRVRSDGTFDVKEARGATMRGSMTARRLEGDIAFGAEKRHVTLDARSPFDTRDADLEATFAATIGSTRSRVSWKQTGFHARARWQLSSGETHDLEGDVVKDTGAFDLVETDGGHVVRRWQGALVSPLAGIARSSSRGSSEPLVLDGALPTWEYPSVVTLPSGERVTPAERVERGPMGCVSGIVYPVVAGRDTTSAALRTLLGVGVLADTSRCDLTFAGGWWNESGYVVTAFASGWFALRVRGYTYMGGAHGMYGSQCRVVDVTSGKLVDLAKELSPSSLAKLRQIVRAAILKERHAKSLVDVGFTADDPDIDASRALCVVDDHGARFLEVEYGDMDAGGVFRFEAPPRIAGDVVRPLFPPTSVAALAFR